MVVRPQLPEAPSCRGPRLVPLSSDYHLDRSCVGVRSRGGSRQPWVSGYLVQVLMDWTMHRWVTCLRKMSHIHSGCRGSRDALAPFFFKAQLPPQPAAIPSNSHLRQQAEHGLILAEDQSLGLKNSFFPGSPSLEARHCVGITYRVRRLAIMTRVLIFEGAKHEQQSAHGH